MLLRLVAALHRWAETGWAEAATATWELLQSSVLPGPSGVVFAPLVVADPPRAPRLAVWAFVGAALGGCIAYFIGAHAFDALGRPMLSALGVGEARIAASEAAFARHGWLLVFLSTVSPLSNSHAIEGNADTAVSPSRPRIRIVYRSSGCSTWRWSAPT